MSRQKSPFDALTSRERQERWLEFQSLRLPYIHENLDQARAPFHEKAPAEPPKSAAEHRESAAPAAAPISKAPAQAVLLTSERQAFQQARHQQYDAVIKRMMDARRQATHFQSVSNASNE